ncbi:MAG TPA: permease prefix domain 2-containing transporter [Gemmatimonadaceae bacterium]|nr:permease prefix domain 2-containing transporter [Gemmatimonadaceae bacterium]
MEPNVTVPRTAAWLLGWLLTDANRDGVLGDLTEEFALRARRDSLPNASRWYWRQVVRSLPRFFWSGFRRGQWRAPLGAAVAAQVFITFGESLILIPLARTFDLTGSFRWLVEMPIGFAAMTLGGFVAAWMRRGADVALAVLSTIMIIVFMIVLGGASPRWYQITFLVLGPVAILTGGALLRRKQAAGKRPSGDRGLPNV